jgi:hypothetical protein
VCSGCGGLKRMSKVLAILAHCDDEIVCGWPVLQNSGYDRYLLIIAMRERGNKALRAVCQNEGINLIEHGGFKNRFSERKGVRREVEELLDNTINKIEPDYIFTHSGSGEYGHSDHLFLNDCVFRKYSGKLPIITSDIEIRSERWPKRIVKERGESIQVEMDTGFWNRCKAEYEKTNRWTTNKYIELGHLSNKVQVFTCKEKREEKAVQKVAWLCDTHGWAFANQVCNLSEGLPDYEHKLVVLKFDKANTRYLYSEEDHKEIDSANLVMAMTPSALAFTDRRTNIITRLSGMRSV